MSKDILDSYHGLLNEDCKLELDKTGLTKSVTKELHFIGI